MNEDGLPRHRKADVLLHVADLCRRCVLRHCHYCPRVLVNVGGYECESCYQHHDSSDSELPKSQSAKADGTVEYLACREHSPLLRRDHPEHEIIPVFESGLQCNAKPPNYLG